MSRLYTNYSQTQLNQIIKNATLHVLNIVPYEKKVVKTTPLLQFLDCIIKDSDTRNSFWEFETNTQAYRRLLPNYILSSLVDKKDQILDIGSHHGMVGNFLSNHSSKVLMMDCSLKAWDISKKLSDFKLPKNKLFDNCIYLYGGIGEKTGIQKFTESKVKSVSNSLYKERVSGASGWISKLFPNKINSYNVPIYPFNDIQKLFKPNLIKIDAEGEDIKILSQILANNKKDLPHTIYLECKGNKELDPILEKYNHPYESILSIYYDVSKTKEMIKMNEKEIFNNIISKSENAQNHFIISQKPKNILINSLEKSIGCFIKKWNFED